VRTLVYLPQLGYNAADDRTIVRRSLPILDTVTGRPMGEGG
jgi:hypothetical protein